MAIILAEETTTSETLIETLVAQAKGRPSKAKTVEENDDIDEEDVAPKKASKKGKDVDEDEDDEDDDTDGEDVDDDDWDPDFEEFDLPKSKKGKGKGEEEEEDFKVEEDEEFKDMDLFNDTGLDEEEEDF